MNFADFHQLCFKSDYLGSTFQFAIFIEVALASHSAPQILGKISKINRKIAVIINEGDLTVYDALMLPSQVLVVDEFMCC